MDHIQKYSLEDQENYDILDMICVPTLIFAGMTPCQILFMILQLIDSTPIIVAGVDTSEACTMYFYFFLQSTFSEMSLHASNTCANCSRWPSGQWIYCASCDNTNVYVKCQLKFLSCAAYGAGRTNKRNDSLFYVSLFYMNTLLSQPTPDGRKNIKDVQFTNVVHDVTITSAHAIYSDLLFLLVMSFRILVFHTNML